MAERTAIEWCDATWSPWEGCTKVGPGCDHCYAEGMNRWLRKGANWGTGAPRREYSDEHWQKPLRWNAKAAKEGKRVLGEDPKRRGRYRLACFGRKAHYRKDGSCKHTAELLEGLRPEFKGAVTVDGWGGKPAILAAPPHQRSRHRE